MTSRERLDTLSPRFVELIPANSEDLISGIVYISAKHKTVVHRCPCGCGGLSEFVLSPTRFRMTYDGDTVTFSPSVGNPHLDCRSHYWIRGNQVQWCLPMRDWEIRNAREREHRENLDARRKQDFHKGKGVGSMWGKIVKLWRR